MDGKKPYTILTSSHKGGVGKTIVSINIAAALRSAGYDVLLVDTDTANPSIGPLLGMPDPGPGYFDIVDSKIKPEDTLIVFEPVGFYIIPAGGKGEVANTITDAFNKFYAEVSKLDFDFIIIDTPPGIGMDGILKNFDEAIIVTTPEETAVFSAQKLSKLYTDHHLIHKLVINRVKKDKYQLDEGKIEAMYGDIAYAMIPEDEIVTESEAKHIPAYLINRKSLFAIAIDDLCRSYTLKAGEPNPQGHLKKSGFGRIRRFFGM